jgi:hypothetical protein
MKSRSTQPSHNRHHITILSIPEELITVSSTVVTNPGLGEQQAQRRLPVTTLFCDCVVIFFPERAPSFHASQQVGCRELLSR